MLTNEMFDLVYGTSTGAVIASMRTLGDDVENTIKKLNFVANNATFFALVDALGPLNIERQDIRLLSIGTGGFPQRTRFLTKILDIFTPTIVTLAKASSNTVKTLRSLIFKDVHILGIDEKFTNNRYRSDLLEARKDQLNWIYQLGRKSFSANEGKLKKLFDMDEN